MNVIGYSVYLQLVINDEQIKQQLQMSFMQWFQRVIGNGDSCKDNLFMNNINSKNSRSNGNNNNDNKSESGEYNNCNNNSSSNKLKSYI